MQKPYHTPILLHGWKVDSSGKADKGYLLLEDGFITHNGVEKPSDIPNGTIETVLEDSEVIFPGLLDLHSHVNYNMIRLWDYSSTGIDCFDNRFEWRANDDYKRQIEELNHYIRTEWKPVFTQPNPPTHLPYWMFSELQAIAGGTTVLQETEYLTSDDCYENEHVLVRSTGVPTDLNLSKEEMIDTAVDFYEAVNPNGAIEGRPYEDTSHWYSDPTQSYKDYLDYVTGNRLKGALIHLAEGRSGFLCPNGRGVDAYTRNEFLTFKQDCYNHIKPEDMRRTNMAFIHGCGIDESSLDTINYLKNYGVSVIWSPVSNLLLYKDTLCIFPLLMNQIDVAIGSDWSPSGSKNVWGEAKFAKFFLETIGVQSPDLKAQVYAMVTSNAAKTININQYAGTLNVGAFADCFILHSQGEIPVTPDNALDLFFETPDSNVRCVTIAGRPVYGDEDLLSHFKTSYQHLPTDEGPFAANKVVHYPDYMGVDLQASILGLDQVMAAKGATRSKFLVADDQPYQEHINALKKWLSDNYSNYLNRNEVQSRFSSVLG